MRYIALIAFCGVLSAFGQEITSKAEKTPTAQGNTVSGRSLVAPTYTGRPGESAESMALGQSALDAAYVYRDLYHKWLRRRGSLSADAVAQLEFDLAEAKRTVDALTIAHGAVRPPKYQSK